MTPTIGIDHAQLNAQLRQYKADMGRSAVRVVKDQARLFLRDLIGATPPFGRHAFNRREESYNAQRKIGEAAVRRDVRRVFKRVSVLARFIARKFPEQPKLFRKILRYAQLSDVWAIRTILDRMGFRGRVEVIATAKEHHARRNRRGRVSKRGEPVFILEEKSITSYERETVGHVGKGKAGWVQAALGLGVAIPNWIKRHATPGVFKQDVRPENCSVTMGNLAEYGNEWPSEPFEAAVQNRIRSMRMEVAKRVEAEARRHGAK